MRLTAVYLVFIERRRERREKRKEKKRKLIKLKIIKYPNKYIFRTAA